MARMETLELVRAYYDCFNRRDIPGTLALLTPDVIHDVSQGEREHGLDQFAVCVDRMNRCYREQVLDLVIMATDSGDNAAAEFVVEGRYMETDRHHPSEIELPEARGQSYRIRGRALFEIRDERIARVTDWYDLQEWLRQVGT
ncbi:nuclear transport factor 2 family protein [Prosthecomicrobium sp. N25]|uniref:nuclear transport factor 2 family protein n=1 Tax=Prosthecomicrobium sp. N25 TaxID=3129254 RepID=UPI003077684F